MMPKHDLDVVYEKIAEWEESIRNENIAIQEYDKIIVENNNKRKAAQEEIERYSRYILNAREMFNLSVVDKKVIMEEPAEERQTEVTNRFVNMTIPESVEELLGDGRLTVTEITRRLREGGFKTSSKNFRNVIQVRLIALAKKGRIVVEKKGNENFYSLPISKS
jgi:hypothetical protein